MKAAVSHFDLLFADRGLPRAVGRVATLIEHHAKGTPLKARLQNNLKELEHGGSKRTHPCEAH
jgi:hypothetical protein